MKPLPEGFGVAADPYLRELGEGLLFGGSPARILRLSAAGRTAYASLGSGIVSSPAAGALARRLTDAGLMHPRPPRWPGRFDATVLVPVKDRPLQLDQCLAALGRDYPVLVVDDASDDPAATAEVAARHGAKLLCRAVNGGPAAARNSGLQEIRSEFVVMIDSDCVPSPGWIDTLADQFLDPQVAAAAPRIVPWPGGDSALDRYSRVAGSLDLGDQEARVAPLTRVSYVPTAALVARRAALEEVGRFDPAMRSGEDVDLVWRLDKAGWRVRYVPQARVHHREPSSWRALLTRRFSYGTSAPHLAERHPEAMPPLVVHPLSALTVAAALARRPLLTGAAFAASVSAMNATLAKAKVPDEGVVPAMRNAAVQTFLGIGHYGVQFAAPLLAAAVLAPKLPGEKHPWGRRLAAAALIAAPGLTAWRQRKPALDPVRYTLATIADDVSYGAGVWTASVRAGNYTALRPVVARRPVQIDQPAPSPAFPAPPSSAGDPASDGPAFEGSASSSDGPAFEGPAPLSADSNSYPGKDDRDG